MVISTRRNSVPSRGSTPRCPCRGAVVDAIRFALAYASMSHERPEGAGVLPVYSQRRCLPCPGQV